jgi:hypothetical protein
VLIRLQSAGARTDLISIYCVLLRKWLRTVVFRQWRCRTAFNSGGLIAEIIRGHCTGFPRH